MCSCWHQALKITLLQIHFSVDLWRDRSWTCSMVYTELKPTGRKAIRLLSRAGRVWAGRLEASAGRWSKPRMCVLSVKKSCWRKQPVSYCRCVGPGSRFHSVIVSGWCWCSSSFCGTSGQNVTPIQHYQSQYSTSSWWHTACFTEKPPAHICRCYKFRFKSPDIHKKIIGKVLICAGRFPGPSLASCPGLPQVRLS